MTVRFCLLLFAPLLAGLALLPAAPARAQGRHVELSSTVLAVGEVTLSFDLPAEYTVTGVWGNVADAEGPAAGTQYLQPTPETLSLTSLGFWSRGTPREAAQEVVAEELGDSAGPILAEGPLTVGEFEAYEVRVREYLYVDSTDAYDTDLLMVVRVASEDDPLLYPPPEPGGNGYVWLRVQGGLERYSTGDESSLESGEPLAQEHQRVFDAIVGSLAVSIPPIEEPTPTPEPVQPLPETAAPAPEGERVELEPMEEGGKKYTFSFALPEGYSVVERTGSSLTAHGPLDNSGEPDELEVWLAVGGSREEGTLDEATRAWLEGRCGEDRRPGEMLMEGSVSLGQTDGRFLYWACVWDATMGPVDLVVLIATEKGDYLGVTASHWGPAAEWEEGYEIGGRPAGEVHRANLDAILASLRVNIEDVGAPQPEFAESVPGPDEISTDPEVIGSNITLTLFVIFTFALTSTLFNQTLAENRREIEGWVGRFFTPFRHLTGLVEQRYAAVAEGQPWVQRAVGPAVVLVLTGLIYGFLSPDFGFNTKSVVLFVSLAVGVGAITYLYEGGQALFTRRRFRLGAGVKLYAVALAIAAVCVLFSRLVDFKPGFLYGFVASYTLLVPAALDRRQSGQVVLFPAIALMVLSGVAWVLTMPFGDVTQGSDAWWAALPEGAAVAVFVVGLEGLFFNMIPLSFMDGAKIAEWNRLLWLLMFGAAGFLFWHVLLNQEGAYLEAVQETKAIAAFGLLAFYSLVTLATWAYFRGRVYGWSMPSIRRTRGSRS